MIATRVLNGESVGQRGCVFHIANFLNGHQPEAVTSVLILLDGQRLLSAGLDRTVKIWRADRRPLSPRAILHDHGNQAWVALITPDGKELITAGADRTVKIRPLPPANGSAGVRSLEGHTATIACAAIARSGKVLATGGYDKTIRLWDLTRGKTVAVLKGHEGRVNCLAFAGDGKTLASASGDKTVRLWDVDSGKEKVILARFAVDAAGVAFSPDGQMLAICASHYGDFRKPGGIQLWDVRANRKRADFAGENVPALSVAFSPDGKLLASASPTAPSVKIWDVASGKLVRTIQDSASARYLAFSPDGKLLATSHGSGARRGNGSVQFWDTTTWQEVGFGQAHRDLKVSVAFSPDGRRLATASMDGTTMVWEVPLRSLASKDR